MKRVNAALPAGFAANNLAHPHLETMLVMDPTEAIHAELIFETFDRYFYMLERKDLNGGVAYQIMHNNDELFMTGFSAAEASVNFLVDTDEILTNCGVVPNLFSFFVGQPNKGILDDQQFIDKYAALEEEREAQANQSGGRYYIE